MSKDLFTFYGDNALEKNAPLAERLRPKTLDEFVGQHSILSQGRLLRRAIDADRVSNLLLHGPPGVGKTTLAKIIAENTRCSFIVLNAVLAGIKELREVIADSKKRIDQHGLRTLLFVDEVHRLNTSQQDALLPWIENGTFNFIGATTENPYFEVNKALISRARIFRLLPLESEDLHKLIQRALSDKARGYGTRKIDISNEACNHLVDVANGDARSLLNALELAVETTSPDEDGLIKIDLLIAEESIQERAILYDKNGDAHFDTISAFIKSLRGSDPDAALFWLARMVEAGENPRFIFRRMLIAAAEDVGLADPQAVVVVEACAAAFERIGFPEGLYLLSQAALYLANTEKSNSSGAIFEAINCVRESQRQEVPSHLRDSHRDKESFGDGLGYQYPHSFLDNWVSQQYLPNKLQGKVFWNPTNNGWEGKRRSLMLERRASQFAAISNFFQDETLFLTNGPEIPMFNKWLDRMLSQESERLQKLLYFLWDKVSWKRHDRVLVFGNNALLWSVIPLKNVPEGGVTIMIKPEQHEGLLAQLKVLDDYLRPTLINDNFISLNTLPLDNKFEWICGRINYQDLNNFNQAGIWSIITGKCSSSAGIRILLSIPLLGPTSSLMKLLVNEKVKDLNQDLFDRVILKEKNYIKKLSDDKLSIKQLKDLGWQIEWNEYEEDLLLKIDQNLVNRWFGQKSEYLDFLDDYDSKYLKDLMIKFNGKSLPQKIKHKKIIGNLTH